MEDMEQHTNERSAEAVHTEASASHTSPHFPKKPLSAVLKWALILAIIIIVNVFYASVIQLAYPAPEYTDFCTEKETMTPDTKESCEAENGKWYEENGYRNTDTSVEIPLAIDPTYKGYCDRDYVCRGEYEDAHDRYARDIFIAWVTFGIILILVSVVASHLGAIIYGFSLGGVLALIVGTIGYWSNMDEYLRVIVLGIALIVLIVLGIRKFKD
jgi:hypothetical protein